MEKNQIIKKLKYLIDENQKMEQKVKSEYVKGYYRGKVQAYNLALSMIRDAI